MIDLNLSLGSGEDVEWHFEYIERIKSEKSCARIFSLKDATANGTFDTRPPDRIHFSHSSIVRRYNV